MAFGICCLNVKINRLQVLISKANLTRTANVLWVERSFSDK